MSIRKVGKKQLRTAFQALVLVACLVALLHVTLASYSDHQWQEWYQWLDRSTQASSRVEPPSDSPFDVNAIKAIPYEIIDKLHARAVEVAEKEDEPSIEWSKYAYVHYASSEEHLCGALVNFDKLKDKTKAKSVLLYKKSLESAKDAKKLLEKAKDQLNVELVPVRSNELAHSPQALKISSLNLTDYSRIVVLDPDTSVRAPMDELFTLPPAMLALPIQYNRFRDFDKISVDLKDSIPSIPDRYEYLHDYYYGYLEMFSLKTPASYWSVYSGLPSIEASVDLLSEYHLKYELNTKIVLAEPNAGLCGRLLLLDAKNTNDAQTDPFNKLLDLKRLSKGQNFFASSNETFKPLFLTLPHHPYSLYLEEFRMIKRSHDCLLADPLDLPYISYDYTNEDRPYWSYLNYRHRNTYGWNAQMVYDEAKVIQFIDSPFADNWAKTIEDKSFVEEERVTCVDDEQVSDEESLYRYTEDCDAVRIWNDFYVNYQNDRTQVCSLE